MVGNGYKTPSQPNSNQHQTDQISRSQFEGIADLLGLTIPDGDHRRGPNPFTRQGTDGTVLYWPELNLSNRDGSFKKSRHEVLKLAGASLPVKSGQHATLKIFDTRSLEERGLSTKARQFFRISGPLGLETPWGEFDQWPTYHPDGSKARHCSKFRDPSRQPTETKDGKPRRQAKKIWDKATEPNGIPIAYGLNWIEPGERVYIVNSELAVWLFWQEGQRAICPLGEGRSEKSWNSILHEIKDKGASEIVLMLDADERGQKASKLALSAARIVDLPASAKQWANGVKVGYDASDFWEECRTSDSDFDTALAELASAVEGAADSPYRFPRLKLREIFDRPRIEWLIKDILLERGTGVVSADYGAFKSFTLLDMGLCIATGKPWHGREVKKGKIAYIIAEGAYTTADRARAWLIRYGIEEIPDNFELIEMPVQIGDDAQRALLTAELRELSPALVIFDTLAKCNLGRDENDATAMSLFTHGMEVISRELNALVLAVHHNNKSGSTRGSNSLPANVDTHIILKRSPDRTVTIECDKQKGAPFEPFSLIGRVVELPELDEYGRPVTSLVFEAVDTPTETISKADQSREAVLKTLQEAPNGLTATTWQAATGLSASRFYDHRDALVKANRVTKDGRLYKVTPITPITPIRSKSERNIYSDYSDDPLGSEQSELFVGTIETKATIKNIYGND